MVKDFNCLDHHCLKCASPGPHTKTPLFRGVQHKSEFQGPLVHVALQRC